MSFLWLLLLRHQLALLGTLDILLDDGAHGLDKDDHDQDETLEGILNIHAEAGDGDDDKVFGWIL